jgi:hypothetical protein
MKAQQDIPWLVNNYHKTDDTHVALLDNLVDEYPFCSAFHVWRVDLAHRLNDPEIEQKLQTASFVVQDRTVLFNIINNDGLPEVTIIPDNPAVESGTDNNLPEKEDVLEEVNPYIEETVVEPEIELSIQVEHDEPVLEAIAQPQITEEILPEQIIEEPVEFSKEKTTEPVVESIEPELIPEPESNEIHDFMYWLKKSKGENPAPQKVESSKPIQEETASEIQSRSSIWDDLAGKSSSEFIEEAAPEIIPPEVEEIPIDTPEKEIGSTEKGKTIEDNPLERLYKEEAYRWEQEALSAKPQVKKKPRKVELIDRFIESNPSIHNSKKDDTKKIENKARKSGDLSPVLATETLADIMVKQGHYEKAINILEDLILKMPHKKPYFASRIEQIREDYLIK